MNDRPMRILLIDDDEDSYVITRGLLSQVEGVTCDLEWLDTYEAGLEALRQAQHDACLLDYQLGKRDGLELLREAIDEGCRAPIIMLTGQGDQGIDMLALKVGAADYLVKAQLDGPVLVRAVRYAIERARTNEQHLMNETHLRMVTDQLPAVLWTTDKQLRFTSSLGAGLFGLKLRPNEVVGKTLFEYFRTEDEGHPVIEATRRALRGESVPFETTWLERTYRGHVDLLRPSNSYIAGTIGVALDITDHKQIQEDLQVARRIQRGLLPAQAPALPGFDIAGACHPAAATGGDYFDYLATPDGSLGIVIADVSNHGFAPALIMSATRRLLRTLAERSNDPGEILTAANRAIAEDTRGEHFVTLFFARLDPRTHSLVYAGAGHEGYVLDDSDTVKKLDSTALPLGVEQDTVVPLGQSSILEPGQLLVLLTDGIAEAMAPDGSFFGTRRALAIVHAHRTKPAAEILDLLYREVQEFCRPYIHHDDVTAVLLKVQTNGDRRQTDREDNSE